MTIEEISSALNKALEKAGYKPVRVVIETNKFTGRDVMVDDDNGTVLVHIYPALINKTSFVAVKSVLCELGDYFLDQASVHQKALWEKRFVRARPDQVSLFQEKLSSGNYPRFSDIIQSIERSTDRLVAIHLANGLISNGQNASSAQNIKVLEWGTTSEFAHGKKPYSLIPLISVYASAEVYQHFNQAFADAVLSGLSSICESSVRRAYLDLVHTVTHSFRK